MSRDRKRTTKTGRAVLAVDRETKECTDGRSLPVVGGWVGALSPQTLCLLWYSIFVILSSADLHLRARYWKSAQHYFPSRVYVYSSSNYMESATSTEQFSRALKTRFCENSDFVPVHSWLISWLTPAPLTRYFHWWIMAPYTNWMTDWVITARQNIAAVIRQIISSIDLFLSYRTDSTDSRTI